MRARTSPQVFHLTANIICPQGLAADFFRQIGCATPRCNLHHLGCTRVQLPDDWSSSHDEALTIRICDAKGRLRCYIHRVALNFGFPPGVKALNSEGLWGALEGAVFGSECHSTVCVRFTQYYTVTCTPIQEIPPDAIPGRRGQVTVMVAVKKPNGSVAFATDLNVWYESRAERIIQLQRCEEAAARLLAVLYPPDKPLYSSYWD